MFSKEHEVRLKVSVRAVFWKDGETWRGECIEVDASSAGDSWSEARDGLYSRAYQAAYQELAAGRLPVRNLKQVDSSLLARWDDVVAKGGIREVDQLRRGAEFEEALENITLDLSQDVENAEANPGVGPLKILLIQDEDLWAAQCLEYDLIGQGPTQENAVTTLMKQLLARVTVERMLGKEPLADLAEAPSRFWELYERASTSEIVDGQTVRVTAA